MLSSLISFLSCKDALQKANICATLVPVIWDGTSGQFSGNARRRETFVLYCEKVLKATQVSSACILLALFYIHRLRSRCPLVRGCMGSEIRLLTTALMLANKFLDDNTFTNKTWSEVSSIPLYELNIMEVEFLSALDYRIYLDHLSFFSWVSQCQRQPAIMMTIMTKPYRSIPNSQSSPSLCVQNQRQGQNRSSTAHPGSKRTHLGAASRRVHVPYPYPSSVQASRLPSCSSQAAAAGAANNTTLSYSSTAWRNHHLPSSASFSSLLPLHSSLSQRAQPSCSYGYYCSATLAASSIVAAAAVNANQAMLTSRMRCLDIE